MTETPEYDEEEDDQGGNEDHPVLQIDQTDAADARQGPDKERNTPETVEKALRQGAFR